MNNKKCYRIAEEYCKRFDLIFVGINSILKGNRLDISVGRQGVTDENGKLITRNIIIRCGTQELECDGFIYVVIRNYNECGTDGISIHSFTKIDSARKWIKRDITNTLVCNDIKVEAKDLYIGNNRYVYVDGDDTLIDWSIRKVPLQTDDTWVDEMTTHIIKYRNNKRKTGK